MFYLNILKSENNVVRMIVRNNLKRNSYDEKN